MELADFLGNSDNVFGQIPLRIRLDLPEASRGSFQENPRAIFEPFHTQFLHLASSAATGNSHLIGGEAFLNYMKEEFGNATFMSAYQRTGRILAISVSACFMPSGANTTVSDSSPIILSYVTSPHVLLYSAISASCALPGLIAPTVLLTLNSAGETVPYHPPGVAALDGSCFQDFTTSELAKCFNSK